MSDSRDLNTSTGSELWAKFLCDAADEQKTSVLEIIKRLESGEATLEIKFTAPAADMARIYDEREEFNAAWSKRPWTEGDETDKDRAWRWWRARADLTLSSQDRT